MLLCAVLLLMQLVVHCDWPWATICCCAGDSIASCSGDKTVRVWRRHGACESWICAAILEETHHRSIRCSSWSPDGRYLATASFDATTAIWEVQVSLVLPDQHRHDASSDDGMLHVSAMVV